MCLSTYLSHSHSACAQKTTANCVISIALCLSLSRSLLLSLNTNICIKWTVNVNYYHATRDLYCATTLSLARSVASVCLTPTHGSEWNRTLIANCNSQLAPACNTPDALTEPSCPLQCRAEEASAVMGLHAGYRRAGQCRSPPAGYGIHQSNSILRRGSGCGCHCKAAGSTATPYHRLGHQGGKIAWWPAIEDVFYALRDLYFLGGTRHYTANPCHILTQ